MTVGPVTRRLLALRDQKLRRCRWCGEWAYALEPCAICHTPAKEDA